MVSVNLLKLLHIVSGFPPNDPNGFPQLDQRITVSCEPLQDKMVSEVEATFAGWKRSEKSLVVAITEYHLIEI